MRIIFLLTILLSGGLQLFAQKLPTPVNAVSNTQNRSIRYSWQSSKGATDYKVIIRSYRGRRFAGEFELKQTPDTFYSITLKAYQQKLDEYKATYCEKKNCTGKDCYLRYETYLVAVNKTDCSKAVQFKMFWR
jgi:hypothetical protein